MTESDNNYQTRSMEWEGKLERWKAQLTNANEATMRSASYGMAAIKGSIFINGAAAIFLLAFIGQLWGKDSLNQILIEIILSNMKLFVIGVVLGVLANGAAYFSEGFYGLAARPDEERKWPNRVGIGFSLLAIGLFATALVLFIIGIWNVADGLLLVSKS